MKELFETYYDAHIKTHQRHVLISWLESAKSEKIKKLSDMAIPTDKRYVVSANIPEMTALPSFSDKEAISKLFENISVGVDMSDNFSIKDYDSLDHSKLQELFAGFIVNTEIPQTVSIDDQTEENKKAIQERFAGITVNTDIPQAVSVDAQTEENKKAIQERFAGITVNTDIPQTVSVDDQTDWLS